MALSWFKVWNSFADIAISPADGAESGDATVSIAPTVTTALTNVSADVQVTTDADSAFFVAYIWIVTNNDTELTGARDDDLTLGTTDWWTNYGAGVRFIDGHWIPRKYILTGSNACLSETVSIPCPTNVTLQSGQHLTLVIKLLNKSGGAKTAHFKAEIKYDYAES